MSGGRRFLLCAEYFVNASIPTKTGDAAKQKTKYVGNTASSLRKGITLPKKKANPVDAHVGYRVRLRRMLIGMSQERLGELLGLTFQQVQKYERGINRIGAGRLFEVAEILGVPINFFYEGIDGIQASGDTNGGQPAAVMDFLSSSEGIQLSTAFMSIKDVKVRRRILDLVRTISGENHSGMA